MKTREVEVKGVLNPVPGEDEWFGLSYHVTLDRGCEHPCICCDMRRACYQIENFNEEVLVKANALELLEEGLPRKRKKGVIGFESMNEPCTPAERSYGFPAVAVTALPVIRAHGPGCFTIYVRGLGFMPVFQLIPQSGRSAIAALLTHRFDWSVTPIQ